jgi:hypothetical protein
MRDVQCIRNPNPDGGRFRCLASMPLVPLHHPFPIAIPRGSLTLGWLDAQIATLTGFAEAEGFELVKTFEEIETGNGQTRSRSSSACLLPT